MVSGNLFIVRGSKVDVVGGFSSDFVMLAIRHKRSSHEGPALDSNGNSAVTGADSRGVLGQTMVEKFC